MKIVICEYPATLVFNTNKKLPGFKYGCQTRTKIAEKQLAKNRDKIKTHHDVKDFLVERVVTVNGIEFWHLGS